MTPENPWLTTASGHHFPLLNPKPTDVFLKDISHALGQMCRFTGHTSRVYTVAEHSVLVSLILKEQGQNIGVQIAGLFHDAHEAYVGDMATPVKWALENLGNGIHEWRALEQRVQEAINARFYVSALYHDVVKQADKIALATEARDLLPNAPILWPEALPEPYVHNVEIAMYWAQWLYTHDLSELLTPADLFVAVYDSLISEDVSF